MNKSFFAHNLWRWKCGIPEKEIKKPINYGDLQKTEWSSEFENLQRNRLIMGAFRYGLISEPGKPTYDRIEAAIKRLRAYQRSGNDELLVDVANFMMLEYIEGVHPEKHFNSVDDGEHVRIKL